MKQACLCRATVWLVAVLNVVAITGSRVALGQMVAAPLPNGSVGIGTYATVSQFKDLVVTTDAAILLQKSLAEGLSGLEVAGGQWSVVDGLLQQSATDAKGMNIFTGDKGWTDYVVSVKARKVGGKEGFSLAFRARDERNFACLNVGGWGNTKTQFGITVNGTFSEIGSFTPIKVEEDRWYEVKVDVKGDEATGFVDGQKVAFATLVPPPPKPAGGGGGNAGGGGRGGASPGPGAAPVAYGLPPEPTSVWDRLILVGGTVVITGLVVAGVMWVRSRLNVKA